jgi:hypothetical protein
MKKSRLLDEMRETARGLERPPAKSVTAIGKIEIAA